MFLSATDIQRLTGYHRPSAQIRWLQHNGWRYSVNGLRVPVVAVAESERKLVDGSSAVKYQEPDFSGINDGSATNAR